MHNNKDQRDIPLNATRFWIIGAGRFGRIAVERITRHISHATLIVVDQKPLSIDGADITTIREEGIEWLDRSLVPDAPVDMIVPAIPVHVAAAWLKRRLRYLYEIHPYIIQDAWLDELPHPMRGAAGQAFVSHADFVCPDNCSEPARTCTHTGKPRPMDLFRLLDSMPIEDVLPVIVRSHQLLPGVGGIYPSELLSALDTVCHNSHRPIMIATACRCHGVLDFMRLEKRADEPGHDEPSA